MRFHVVALPHTQVTKAFAGCAYTEKVRRFCNMMKSLGHTVYLYAGEENEANVDELITCITETQRRIVVGNKPYVGHHSTIDCLTGRSTTRKLLRKSASEQKSKTSSASSQVVRISQSL